jgi:hypothetical protein
VALRDDGVVSALRGDGVESETWGRWGCWLVARVVFAGVAEGNCCHVIERSAMKA